MILAILHVWWKSVIFFAWDSKKCVHLQNKNNKKIAKYYWKICSDLFVIVLIFLMYIFLRNSSDARGESLADFSKYMLNRENFRKSNARLIIHIYFVQRAEIRPEKSSDQCLAICIRNSKFLHLEWSNSLFNNGQNFTKFLEN